jgi:hypothetical protein
MVSYAASLGLMNSDVLLLIAAVFLVFPFMVARKFNELIQVQKRILEVLEKIERSAPKSADEKAPSPVHYSIEEPSSYGGVIFGAVVVVLIIVVVVVLTRR